MDADVGKETTLWRTSSTHFLDKACTPMVAHVELRVAFFTKHPPSYAEGVQVRTWMWDPMRVWSAPFLTPQWP